MEDNTIRAIIIAIMVFMFVITVTAILLYYNAMKDNANDILDLRVDYGEVYKKEVSDLQSEIAIANAAGNYYIVNGSELKDFIRANINKYSKIKLMTRDVTTENIEMILVTFPTGVDYKINSIQVIGTELKIQVQFGYL